VPDRPLLATTDHDLLDDLLRLCAAAGVEAQVAHEVAAARAEWSAAPLVVVDDDVSAAALAAGLARRPDVVLVARDLCDDATWERASRLGASVVVLPDAERWLLDRLAGTAVEPVPDATTIAVLGGRGGAGASILACALATTGAARCPTVLVDADPLGGGLDLLLGVETAPGLRWRDLAGAGGTVSPAALVRALPRASGLPLLSWDRGDPVQVPADTVGAVLAAVRGSHRLVVADLPRRLDAAAEVVAVESDVVLLVVPAEVRAAAAAGRVAAAVARFAGDVRVVVRGPAPSGLTGPDVARSLGLPLEGWLRPEPGLAAALERGEAPGRSGRGPLAQLCGKLLDTHLAELRPAA